MHPHEANAQAVKAIDKLRKLSRSRDTEAAHSKADQVLLDFITSLGFHDVTKAWENVPKWFA